MNTKAKALKGLLEVLVSHNVEGKKKAPKTGVVEIISIEKAPKKKEE